MSEDVQMIERSRDKLEMESTSGLSFEMQRSKTSYGRDRLDLQHNEMPLWPLRLLLRASCWSFISLIALVCISAVVVVSESFTSPGSLDTAS